MKLLTILLFFTSFAQATVVRTINPVIPFKKVVWIWLENTAYDTMANQKYIRGLWLNYPSVRFTNVKAVSPVTQANVVAMISGNDFGIQNNELLRLFTPTIVNLLESKNVTWKVYADQYLGSCYQNEGTGEYRRYRVPFLSVSQIQTDHYLCSKVVNFGFLQDDLKYAALPQLSFVIPGLSGSGATTGISTAQYTLKNILDPILYNSDMLAETTIIITTTNNADDKDPLLFSMIIGNGVSDYAMTNDEEYNHYSTLRTIEDGFELGQLNQKDSKAGPMVGFWK